MNGNQENQGIAPLELIKQLLSKWWLILLLMIIFGGLSYYVSTEYMVPEYQAKCTIFIGKDAESLAGTSLNDISLDTKLVNDYRQLIKTKLVTSEVIDQLSLSKSNVALVEKLGIEIVAESRFLYVIFNDPDPELATLIANTISEELADKVQTIVGLDNVQIVDYAEIPLYPIRPSVQMNVIIAVMLGVIVAFAIVLLQMILNNTIQSEEDAEKTFGIAVLGVIPKFKGEVR